MSIKIQNAHSQKLDPDNTYSDDIEFYKSNTLYALKYFELLGGNNKISILPFGMVTDMKIKIQILIRSKIIILQGGT